MVNAILLDLKGENNEAYGNLYLEYFGMVLGFVLRNNGNAADAEDVFQDAMVVLFEKLKNDNFELTASLKTYIFAIAKNLWLKHLRDSSREVELELCSPALMQEIDLEIDRERTAADRLRVFFQKITKHCQRLLNDIFFHEKSIENIQSEYGYSTKHNAINQKHKCLNQIKKAKEERL